MAGIIFMEGQNMESLNMKSQNIIGQNIERHYTNRTFMESQHVSDIFVENHIYFYKIFKDFE